MPTSPPAPVRPARALRWLVVALVCALTALLPAASASAQPLSGSSQAAPPPRHRHGGPRALGDTGDCHGYSSICYYYLTNKTPYSWHLAGAKAWYSDGSTTFPFAGTQNHGVYCQPPVADVLPGQTMCFALDEENLHYAQAAVYYTFDDVDGNRHRVDYNVNDDGEPVTYAVDLDAQNHVVTTSSPTFHMALDADGDNLSIDALLNRPAERTIDARTDPTTAAAVMNQFTRGTNQNFTPASKDILYTTGPFSRTSALVANTTAEPASLLLSSATGDSQTTSLNLEVGWSAGLQIFGLVNTKVSATVDGGHSWTASDNVTNSMTITISPGDVGWIEAAVTTASVVGNFDFTTPENITYHVLNATVTKPGIGPDGRDDAITWRVQHRPIASMPGALGPRSSRTGQDVWCAGGHGRHHVHRCEPPRATTRCARFHGKACVRWSRPAATSPVVIDARTDPNAAAAAMALYPKATDATFSATAQNPYYSNTPQSKVSNRFENPATQKTPATGTLTVDHTDASSWSVGGSVGGEVTLAALGLANTSVSMTFSAHHEWVSSSTMSQSVSAQIDPGRIAWIEAYTRQVTFSGNYAFTANGTSYQVDNVSITEPGNSETGPGTATTYIVKDAALPPSLAKRFTRPGPVPQSQAKELS